MYKFVLASRNRHKISELEAILSLHLSEKFEILSLDDIGFTDDIEENGNSFEENALIKATIPAKLGYFGIADDSGLCVDALGGAPGIYSARYAGKACSNEENNKKLLHELEGVPQDRRGAVFVCTIAIVAPNMKKAVAVGECRGFITSALQGKEGFGYDPLFFYPEKNKTFAELSANEKNAISHRALAVEAFARLLPDFMKGYK